MRWRDLLLSALVAPLLSTPAPGQVSERIWRVGVLTPDNLASSRLRQFQLPELAKLGFVEGRNLRLSIFSAEGAYDRLPTLAVELVATAPDVIMAIAPAATRAARAATSTIPIIMAFGGEDPVAAGWAQSYARPGGNVTGIVMLSPELDGKRLHALHDAFPMRRRIAVLLHPAGRNNERAIEAVAARTGIETLRFHTTGNDGYDAAFAAIRASGAEALVVGSGPGFTSGAARIAKLALEAGLPTICEWREMAEQGCLIGYGPKLPVLRRRTAEFVARILGGTPAGELPIEEPTAFDLAINLKTARALGIEVPSSLLALADEVFE